MASMSFFKSPAIFQSADNPNDQICFICGFDPNLTPGRGLKPTLEDFMVLFEDILQLPASMLKDQWKSLGPPGDWICLCSQCLDVLREKKRLKIEIAKLEKQSSTCSRSVLNKMKLAQSDLGRNNKVHSLESVQKYVWDYFLTEMKKRAEEVEAMAPNYNVGDEEALVDLHQIGTAPLRVYECNEGGGLKKSQYFCGMGDKCENLDFLSEELLTAHQQQAHGVAFPKVKTSLKKAGPIPVPNSTKKLEKETESFLASKRSKFQGYQYSCPSCPRVRNYSINRYIQHLKIHQRRPYRCTKCSDLLPSDENETLHKKHRRDKHGRETVKYASIKISKIRFNPGPIWKCEGCLVGFTTPRQRELHQVKCSNFRAVNRRKEPLEPISCTSCKKETVFDDFADWRFHRFLAHPEIEAVSCFYCDETFPGLETRDDKQLLEHLEREHPEEMENYGSIHQECEACGVVFAERKSEGKACSVWSFHCKICHKTYASPEMMPEHMNKCHPHLMREFEEEERKFWEISEENAEGIKSEASPPPLKRPKFEDEADVDMEEGDETFIKKEINLHEDTIKPEVELSPR